MISGRGTASLTAFAAALADENGEWEIIARPYTTAGGKNARVRVQRIGEPNVTGLRTWGAHERISVKRAGG